MQYFMYPLFYVREKSDRVLEARESASIPYSGAGYHWAEGSWKLAALTRPCAGELGFLLDSFWSHIDIEVLHT